MNRHLTPSRRIQRLPVWLFAVALVLQIAMPFSQVLANAGAGGTGGPVEICTGTGVTFIYLDADGTASEPTRPAPLPVACEFCHLCQSGGLHGSGLVSKPLALVAPEPKPVTNPVGSVRQPGLPRLMSLPRTRGPPALI